MNDEQQMEQLRIGMLSYPHCFPSCVLYNWLIGQAMKRFNISRSRAREKYGLYSYRRWYYLLNPIAV